MECSSLQRGEILTTDHLEIRRADVTMATGMEAVDVDNIIGLAAKHNLPVGELLSVQDFEHPIVMERGAMSRIIVLNGGIKLCIAGAEALQSGRTGDLILFKNPMNPREPLKA